MAMPPELDWVCQGSWGRKSQIMNESLGYHLGTDPQHSRTGSGRLRCPGPLLWIPGTGSGDLVLIDLQATALNKFIVLIVFLIRSHRSGGI